MENKNKVNALMIISVLVLLISIVGAAYAYFGSFTSSVTNKTVVNSTTESAVTSSLITQAAVLNMTVPSNMMTKGNSGSEILAADENANLVITLNAGRTDIPVTCTYDIMYKNTGTYEYGASPTPVVNSNEFRYKILPYNINDNVHLTNLVDLDAGSLMLQDIANSSNKFAEGYGGYGGGPYSTFAGSKTNPVKVSSGLITNCGYMLAEDTAYIENDDVPKLNLLSNNKKDYKVKFLVSGGRRPYTASESCQSNVTQTYKIGLSFFNIPNVDQSILAGKSFTGEFFVDNVSCNNDLYELEETE